jgi:four helix bundle protein
MALDHERFEVYQAALDLYDLIDEIVEQLPRGGGRLADQPSRAGLSIVNNIAEGRLARTNFGLTRIILN